MQKFKKIFALKEVVNQDIGYLSLGKSSFLIMKIRIKFFPDRVVVMNKALCESTLYVKCQVIFSFLNYV